MTVCDRKAGDAPDYGCYYDAREEIVSQDHEDREAYGSNQAEGVDEAPCYGGYWTGVSVAITLVEHSRAPHKLAAMRTRIAGSSRAQVFFVSVAGSAPGSG